MLVRFASGGADAGAVVRVATDSPPPALPPPLLRPLTHPFTITAEHGQARHDVSVYYPAGVPAQQVPLIFVLVNEGQKWRVLPTHADSSGHTFTAHWPHFSSGVLSPPFDPLFDPLGQLGKRAGRAGKAAGAGAVQIGKDVAAGAATAGQWTWNQVDKAAAWFGDQVTQQWRTPHGSGCHSSAAA